MSGRRSRFSNCAAMRLPTSSLSRGISTGSPVTMHWKNGVCSGKAMASPTGTVSSQRPGSSLCSTQTRCQTVRHIGRAVRESLAGQDRGAQVGAREVGEAGDDGGADLADRAGQVQGGADASADLVEELQPFAHRRVFEVGGVRGGALGARRAARGRRARGGGDLLGRAARHTPVGGDGDPFVVVELQYGIAQFEDLGDDAVGLADPCWAGCPAAVGPARRSPGVRCAGRSPVQSAGARRSAPRCPPSRPSSRLWSSPSHVTGPRPPRVRGGARARGRPVDTPTTARRAGRARARRAARGPRWGRRARRVRLRAGIVVESYVPWALAVRRGVGLRRPAADRRRAARSPPPRVAEKPPRAGRPVRHQAVTVHDDHGERDPSGRGDAPAAAPAEYHCPWVGGSFPAAGIRGCPPRYGLAHDAPVNAQ